MDDDEFDLDDVEDGFTVLPSAPASPLILFMVALRGVRGLFAQVTETLEDLHDTLGMHHNYLYDRRSMAEQAAREIESMIGGVSDG